MVVSSRVVDKGLAAMLSTLEQVQVMAKLGSESRSMLRSSPCIVHHCSRLSDLHPSHTREILVLVDHDGVSERIDFAMNICDRSRQIGRFR